MRLGFRAYRQLREFHCHFPARSWSVFRSNPLSVLLVRSYASVSAADLKFGQPLHETHAHLLKVGELTPGISALEYATRRAKLAARLPENAIAVLASSDIKYRSGFNEPEAAAVIEKTGPDGQHIFHLFVRPKNLKAELWDGARSGVQAAFDVFNADEAGDINQLHQLLTPLIAEASIVCTDIPKGSNMTSALTELYPGISGTQSRLLGILESGKSMSLRPVMNELRVFKSPAEIENMRLAGKFSGRSFTDAMRRTFTKEKDLHAFLECEFKLRGCDTSAYVPVVAGGKEYGGYIADITRTWPANGKFSPAQKDLYQAILSVQRTCVALCREDANVSLDKLHNIAENGLEDQLKQLGFDLSGKALETLFPHHVGHYIGLDVHDSPGYPRTGRLKAGQCITIEPGIYVPTDDRWPKHFRGLGIRIEDSVCIQEEAPLVLTTEAVKEIVDIEALMQ
ncbi:MAG: hypothetical protein M1813_000056 [Trichoglossum hirsutum]|nr:MAG: hypothetical protein M1813_000056 [Trichoglossum hirsutum]